MDLITYTSPAHIARVPRADRLAPFTALCGVEFGPETRTRNLLLVDTRQMQVCGACVRIWEEQQR